MVWLFANLDPFRRAIFGSCCPKQRWSNYSNIARDVGTNDKNVQNYFSILEDTLLGFFLEPFQHSFRKRLSKTPKFYFFDLGVVRALTGQLTLSLNKNTSQYGELFEHFVILQCKYLANYFHREYKFSYLKTKDDAEIDLIVERQTLPLLFIKNQSLNENVQANHPHYF